MNDAYAYEEITINGFPALRLADGRVLQIPAGGEGEGDGAGDGAGAGTDGDAGGGATAEAELKAAEAALAAEHDEDEGDGAAAGDEGGKGKPSRLQKRIQRLVEARKAYDKFGKPDDLARKLSKLDEYERVEARLRKEDEAKRRQAAEQSGEAEIGRKMRGYLDQTFGQGAADKFEYMMQAEAERSNREAVTYAKAGRDHIISILKENQIPTEDPTVVKAYEHAMATFIDANDELHQSYLDPNSQRAALADAFKFAATKLLNPMLAVAGAGTYEQIAARKARALGSGRGSSAGDAVDIADERPPKNATPEQIHAWHKARASKAWDLALDADEASA